MLYPNMPLDWWMEAGIRSKTAKYEQNTLFSLVFRDFDYQNLIFMQNKHDIRNQHQKLHQMTYILSKNIFRQNSTRGGPQGKIE
jgi:hypothetical protein